MKIFFTCLLIVFSRVSVAYTLNDIHTNDLFSSKSLAAIELKSICTDHYESAMAQHSALVSENPLSLVDRVPVLEGLAEPEHGRSVENRPLAQIPGSSYTSDRELQDVGVASEPSSLAMLGTGLLGLAALLKRRIRR